jgi:hypothetical protein
MKIEFITSSESWSEEHDYRQFFRVIIDGERFISCHDDEPEDSNLRRSFSDVFRIPALVKKITEAMKTGEEIIIEEKEA